MNHLIFRSHRASDQLSEIIHRMRQVSANVEYFISGVRLVNGPSYDWSNIIYVCECSLLSAIPKNSHRFTLQQLIHENANHVSISITDVLALPIHVVRPEDDVI